MRTTRIKGFTLIELMIVIAIIGILAGVAIPQYGQYAKRAKFADVIAQVKPYKTAIALCAQDNNTLDPCDSDYADIGPLVTVPIGTLASLTVSDGTIIATGTIEVANAVYKLIPNFSSSKSTLTWSIDHTVANACQGLELC